MRIVSYDQGKDLRAGLAVGEWVADLQKAARATTKASLPHTVRSLLEAGPDTLARARRVARKVEALARKVADGKQRRPAWLLPEETVHLGPPVPDPQKIIAIGLNYLDHCREQEGKFGRSIEPPKEPVIFAKYPTALTGPYDPIMLPPRRITSQVDFEVELCVVIGLGGHRITQKDAMNHVAGYTVMNDVSARDCQFRDKQWVRAKSFNTFAPSGPCLVTADEIPNPHKLKLWTVVNGETMQDSSTDQILIKIPKLIAYISQAITLKPGDLISTGTPAGVGIFREPPLTLNPGDVVECGIESIGTICNTCERM